MPLRHSRAIRVFAVLVFTGVLAGVWLGTRAPSPGLLGELARATRRHGVAGMRVSIVSGFRACDAPARADAPAVAVCGAADGVPSRRTLSLIRRIADAAREGADPQALHAAALALMLFPSAGGNHLDQSISYLQTASRLAERPAPVLADLSAAHLTRARQARSPRDLYQGLEAADRALELEPANTTARFNAAAALQEMGAAEQAREAWTRYLAVDSTSGWAREARRRRGLIRVPRPREAPSRTASRAELEAYAASAPSGARELGWDDLLREWGAAVLDGDTATARARLVQADVIGAELARRGWDASLAHAVDAVRRSARTPAEVRRLARLHRALGEGREAMLALDHASACPRFRRLRAVDTPPYMREWARAFMGFCTLYGALKADVERLAAESDTLRYPAAAGRTWLALAHLQYVAGSYEQAAAAYSQAGALLGRVGEREYAAAALMGEGNARAVLGDADRGYAMLHEALEVLRGYPNSNGRWNALYALRNALLADGFPRAAMRVQDEAVVVSRWMKPELQAETRLARARLHLAAGKRDVHDDTAAAVAAVSRNAGDYVSAYVRADLRQTRAEALLQTNPGRAAAELDSVIRYFADNTPRLLPALFSRAQARLALGMQDSASVDLRRAMVVLDGQRAKVSSAQLRASLLEQSRRVFDQAVMLSLRAGRSEEALEYVERSRASFSPVGRAPDWVQRPLRAPRGEVAVEFALVGDTLLAWTVWDGGIHLTRRTIARAELVRTAERVRSAMELRAPDTVALPALQSLFDQLVRPLRTRLGPSGTPLTIVADGELAGLPMAALYDREQRRYLVEDHPLRFASSLRDPAGTAQPIRGVPVTLVADPAFDRRAFPALERLPGAATEVGVIQRQHRSARVLDGAAADAAAIRSAFERGGIAHFAGHAVFDDARPERSYLVAAAGAADDSPARLTAAEIERMGLDGLRLVVLSACQTSRAQAGRSGGFAGLAGAFLAAGAGGVVGSLWRVDDVSTRTLMERFHAAYRESGDAAGALRHAQLQMLRSADPAVHSPAAWAGFRYAGS